MNPDQSDGVSKIISAIRCDCSKRNIEAPRTVRDFLKLLEVPDMVGTAYLMSMWLCFAVDRGFKDEDFQEDIFDLLSDGMKDKREEVCEEDQDPEITEALKKAGSLRSALGEAQRTDPALLEILRLSKVQMAKF